jgi:hypothetical protein
MLESLLEMLLPRLHFQMVAVVAPFRVLAQNMHVLDNMYSNKWAVMQGSHMSYDLVVVYLWLSTTRSSAPGQR